MSKQTIERPSKGGSYVRDKDGKLQRQQGPDTESPVVKKTKGRARKSNVTQLPNRGGNSDSSKSEE